MANNQLIAAQNAVVNAVPLPAAGGSGNSATAGVDEGDTIPLVEQEPIQAAPADDTHDDGWINSGSIHVASQAEFDALPEERKEVIRAAVAMGGKLPMSDASAIYKEARRTRVESTPIEVDLPDGRKVYKLGSQVIDPLEAQAKELAIKKALEEQDATAAQEGERQVFLNRMNEYRGWVKSGGIVGPGADLRQRIDSIANPDAYTKRWKLGTVIGEQVLANIKKLGANPTEGERKFLLDIQPKITDPAPVWDEYFNTLEGVIKRKAAKEGQPITAAGSPAPVAQQAAGATPLFSSPAEVKSAFKAGKISRDEALKILNGYGMK